MQEIYEKYSNYVYNYLFSLSNNVELSQELMQETFYSAVKNINKFKGNCSVKTWLIKIALNKWKDYLKSSKGKQLLSFDDNTVDLREILLEPSFESEILKKDEILFLYKQIHQLSEDAKEVVYLRLKAELNFKEIGTILGKTEQWARITFHRAKQKLKEGLQNAGY